MGNKDKGQDQVQADNILVAERLYTSTDEVFLLEEQNTLFNAAQAQATIALAKETRRVADAAEMANAIELLKLAESYGVSLPTKVYENVTKTIFKQQNVEVENDS